MDDASIPPVGDGYVYLTQGQNYECGLGSLGFDSNEARRLNSDALACTGSDLHRFVRHERDRRSRGTVTGTIADTVASDNAYESITEQLISGVSQLDHRWTFDVPAGVDPGGARRGLRDASAQPEDMQFRITPSMAMSRGRSSIFPGTSTSDPNCDQWIWLPVVSGPFRDQGDRREPDDGLVADWTDLDRSARGSGRRRRR